jgi:hypothetical protein
VPRNYSTFLQLDDALLFEANLLYGVALDDQQNAPPRLSVMSRLYRVNTMRLLWRHENSVEDKGSQTLLYDFKRDGAKLVDAYRRLLPQLAKAYDRAASRHVIPRNTAARTKSRLTRVLSRQAAAPPRR